MKEVIRKIARKAGYEITRYSPETNHTARLLRCLALHRIGTVVDVGANVGQFASTLRSGGFTGRIISIEPQKHAHAELVERAAKDPLRDWHVLPRVAVGEQASTLDLHISGNSWSTSLLPMLTAHSDAMPSSRPIGIERIDVQRLDALLTEPGVKLQPPLLLKMDVQGYESAVLKGAANVLPQTNGILTELSLTPLYQGQVLWRELCDEIISLGFEVFDIQPGFADPKTGRLLQLDGLFTRRS
jgi:FkbM family methyltransferase